MNEPVRIPYIKTDDPFDVYKLAPAKAHADDAAYDLRAAEPALIPPGCSKLINTGIAVAIPEGYAGLVMRRSGLAINHGVVTLGTGLIDPGYRGDIGVALINLGDKDYTVGLGDRIAQLLFVKTADVELSHATWLPHSERGDAGFGSTGVA